jgi:hypothetical protein
MSTFESIQSVTCDNCPKVEHAKYSVDEGNFLLDIPPGWVAMAPEMASSGLLVPMRCGSCFELLKGREIHEGQRTSEKVSAIHHECLNGSGQKVVRATNADPAAAAAEKALEELVFDLAFAIEDPCGGEELHLARVLVKFAQRIKPEKRRLVAVTFDQFLALNENALIQE